MGENNTVDEIKISKKYGIVGIIFATIGLGVLAFMWWLVIYASVSRDIGAAVIAIVYLPVSVFVAIITASIGVVAGFTQYKKYKTKFSSFSWYYTIIVMLLILGSIAFVNIL